MRCPTMLSFAAVFVTSVVLLVTAGAAFAQQTPPSPLIAVGDLFVSIGHGKFVQVHAPSYSSTTTISIGGGSDQTAGCAVDSQPNLYGVNTSAQNVVEVNQFNFSDQISIPTPALAGTSIVFDASGNFYVGGHNNAGTTATPTIQKFSPTSVDTATGHTTYSGATIQSNTSADWLDIGTDQHTSLVTAQTNAVTIENLAATPPTSSSFTTLPDVAWGIRFLAPYDIFNGLPFGNVLVADSSNIYQLTKSGSIFQTYNTSPSHTTWRFIALDPDNVHIWGGDWVTGDVARFVLSSGAVDLLLPGVAQAKSMGGLCVAGGHQLNVIPRQFSAGSQVHNFFPFGDPMIDSNDQPQVDPLTHQPKSLSYHTWFATFTKVLTPFTMVVSATEGIDLSRFDEYFPCQADGTGCTSFTGPTLVPIPYAEQTASSAGKPVVYRVINPPPSSDFDTTASPAVESGIGYTTPCTTASGSSCTNPYNPPACLLNLGGKPYQTNPRIFRDPSSPPPADATLNHQFAFDFTDHTTINGTYDPIAGHTCCNDFIVADRCPETNGTFVGGFATYLKPLVNCGADGSGCVSKLGNNVTVKLSLTQADGSPITDAITFPNNLNLTIVSNANGQVVGSFGSPGNSIAGSVVFTQTAPGVYAFNWQTKGLKSGIYTLTVTSIETTSQFGVATLPGETGPATVVVQLKP